MTTPPGDDPDLLLGDLLRRAPAEAVAWIDASGTTTFAEACRRVDALRRAVLRDLAASSAPAGFDQRVVAVLAENSGTYLECLYGVPDAGAALVLLNYRHHPGEWAAMLERTGAELVLGDRSLLERLEPQLAGLGVRRLVAFPDGDDSQWRAWLAEPEATDDDGASARGPQATSTAWLVPTSGTTGAPKLARLTHRSLLVAATGCATARPVADDDVYLFVFPLCHVAAYNVLVYHRFARPIVVERRFEVEPALRAVVRHRVTAASLAPTMLAMVLDAPELLERYDHSSLRNVAYGSAAIPEPVLRRAMATLPCNYSQGYGMTELSGNCAFLGPEDHRRGLDDPQLLRSAGFPTAFVELRIVDDDRTPVAPGVVGEIAVRGEQVMAGYWADDDATQVAVVDGWLLTGDLGVVDATGRLRVVDRKKDVVITGGENVASRQVEGVLHDHPAVAAAAVVGVPDDRWGEVVAAVVVCRAPVGRDELDAHCRAHLAGFEVPRRYEFVDELPLNTTGKIDKPALRRALTDGPSPRPAGNTP